MHTTVADGKSLQKIMEFSSVWWDFEISDILWWKTLYPDWDIKFLLRFQVHFWVQPGIYTA